jgi:hypothetical protein
MEDASAGYSTRDHQAMTGSRNGQTSRAHVTTAGPHVLGAHVPSSGLGIVPDTTVNLDAGEAFTRQVVSITPECRVQSTALVLHWALAPTRK